MYQCNINLDSKPRRYCVEIEFGAIGMRYCEIDITSNE